MSQDNRCPVTFRTWRVQGPCSPVRLPCGHVISRQAAAGIHAARQQHATIADPDPPARCPNCRTPWLLPESLPPANDIINDVVEARLGRLSPSLPVRRTLTPPPSERPLTRQRTELFTASPIYNPAAPLPASRSWRARHHRQARTRQAGPVQRVLKC
jgi:hypothetical protein